MQVRGRSDRAVTPTIVIESSQNDTPNDLCIREDTDIANLTAEIESFVKDKDNDDVEPLVITENKTPQKDTKVARDLEENARITTTTVITTNTTVPAAVVENEIQKNQKEIKHVEVHSTTSPPRQESVAQTSVVAKTAIPPSEKVENTVESKTITKTEVKTTTSSNQTPVPNIVVNEDKPKEQPKGNHQVVQEKIQIGSPQKTERVTVKRSTTTVSESPKLVNGQAITVTEDHKEIMSNGAIPKKVNHTKAQTTSDRVENSDMCIEENHGQSQRPLPAQRSTKADTEVGHVECIHVHVESPRATPRENHESKVSSFKADNTTENVEVITTKTPFVLTSPPRQRKSTQSSESTNEPVKITQDKNSTAALELSIQEEPAKVKPEMVEKPTLSPKPILERNDKVHTFAEIHKPMRNKVTHTVANGQVRRTSRDEVVAPPTIPRHHAEEQPQVVQKAKVEVDGESKRKIETQEVVVPREPQTATTNLNIREPSAAVEEHLNDVASGVSQSPTSMGSSTRLSNESLQFESLYRPQSHMEWKRSTLAPLETNIPPEKRKSVKDIIESINRSQRLLHAAANKDFPLVTGPPSTCASPDGEYSDENLRIMDESQREIRRMVQRINHLDGTSSGATTSNGVMMSKASSPPPSYNECIAAQKLENNEIFQKCKVNKEVYEHQRESSPISSNLDWNPVPKPKRTNPRAD